MKKIYLAGGCFWGTQHLLKQIEGVTNTQVGYANGTTPYPTYEEVYTDSTGYAETVHIEYDETKVGLATILDLYFLSIDPTSLNRQGGDCGTRYRTDGQIVEVMFHTEKEAVLSAELPPVLDMEVTYTEPGIKGDTASTNSLKPATVNTGATVRVPLFVNTGDKIRVDSRTREYKERIR